MNSGNRTMISLVDSNDEEEAHHDDEEAGGVYDEVKLGDMEYIAEEETWLYPCPCGDKFFITLDELLDGEDIATCPSCSLVIRVLYDLVSTVCWSSTLPLRSFFGRAIFQTRKRAMKAVPWSTTPMTSPSRRKLRLLICPVLRCKLKRQYSLLLSCRPS